MSGPQTFISDFLLFCVAFQCLRQRHPPAIKGAQAQAKDFNVKVVLTAFISVLVVALAGSSFMQNQKQSNSRRLNIAHSASIFF